MFQITEALQFLHSHEYVHCALTSHAVQLVSMNVAKLGQLEMMVDCNHKGIAEHSQAVLSCALLESPPYLVHYLSPELRGGGTVSKSHDIYSLCCITYQILSGRKASVPS